PFPDSSRRKRSMAITVTCQCGKKLGVKDEMAGKKVRCPACQTVLTVPGGAEEMPPPELAAEEEAPAPKRTTRTVSNGNAAGEPKSKKTLYFIIGGVAGVLLLGCCCLGGVGSWFLFLRGPSGMDAKIIGRWAPDLEAQKKNNPKNESFAGTIEFKS